MIIITRIKQPKTGAVMLFRCPICKTTVITVNQYAARPKDGDAWMLNNSCIEYMLHNWNLENKRMEFSILCENS